jgi:hypothetical protein
MYAKRMLLPMLAATVVLFLISCHALAGWRGVVIALASAGVWAALVFGSGYALSEE